MATLTTQPWGLRGADVTLQAAAAGDVALNAKGVVLVFRNTGGSDRAVTINAAWRCTHNRSHDLSGSDAIDVPNDSARHIVPLGWDVDRFGSALDLNYDDTTGLTVACARMGPLLGIGSDAEMPPALGAGGAVGTITIVRKTETPIWSAAQAGGMVVNGNGGRTQLWITNEGASPRTVYIHSAYLCSQGFHDDEPETVQASGLVVTKDIPVTRFGSLVAITYDAATSLSFAAVRQEAFVG